jgi:hypothetical protein
LTPTCSLRGTYTHPSLEHRKSKIHGHGIFARTWILRGAWIAKYLPTDPYTSSSGSRWGETWAFNSSCEPNCFAWKRGVVAIRDIALGTEIVTPHFCYNHRRKPTPGQRTCRCGALDCCGYVYG